MNTKSQAAFSKLRTPLSTSDLDERREIDLRADDALQEPVQSWIVCLEALLCVSAVAGWVAIAYLYHTNPSFG